MKLITSLLIMSMLAIPLAVTAKSGETKDKPKWVDNPKSEYPDGMYLSAVGSAGSRADAENSAAANLAKIFRSDVSSSTTYKERYKELTSESATEASTETKSEKNVQVKSNQSLYNIEIGKTWTDKLGQVYAVAYIHRLKTADIYEEKINENSKQITHYIQEGLISSNSWKAFACYNIANVFVQNNEELLSQLAIISLDTKESIELGYDPAAIKTSLTQWAKGITFKLNVSGDAGAKIKPVIEEIITSNNFSTSETNAAEIIVEAKLEEVDLNQPQKFIRYYLTLNVADPAGNNIITLTDNAREGHVNIDEAKARAIRTMTNKIKTELPKRLFQYFDSLVIQKKN